jgi:septal ring factor EnvC (AmiA/AmiB activator)
MLPAPAFGPPPIQPAPPAYDPASVMPAMPVSAVYVPVPTPPPQEGGGRRVAVTWLSILLGLFVVASGVLAVLYVREQREATRMSEQIADLEATAAEVQRQLDATERGLRRADEDLADLQAERDALADCLTAIYNFFDVVAAAEGEETPQTEQARLEASRVCREAERYL